MGFENDILRIINTENAEIRKFRDTVIKQASKIQKFMANCGGTLYFTGSGKSGHVALLLSSYFKSIGVDAHFIHPSDALHGDIGIINDNSSFVCISHSGKTREIKNVAKHARKRGAKVLLFTSNTQTKIDADATIYSGIEKEALAISEIPTTSVVASIIFGHILLELIIKTRKIPDSVFFNNHPNGGVARIYKGDKNAKT